MTARSLGIPSATTFDYEFAWLQHQLGARAATRVVVPEAIPAERLAPYGVRKKLRRYPGLKEEYYLADFEPAPVDVPAGKQLIVARTPPEVSLYHRHGNPLFLSVLDRLGRDERAHVVVLPRTDEQRARIRGLGLPSLSVPDRAVEAQSLIAAAAAVVSAGGTMNREAVALGTPVYTTFSGPSRRGRRAADPGGAPDPAARSCPARPRRRCPPGASAYDAIRTCCSTSCSASAARTSSP